MREIKKGALVCFARDNAVKQGTIHHVYTEFDMVVVDVPKDKKFYKVSISDITVMSKPNDQELKNEEEAITLTPTEFKSITASYINELSDEKVKSMLAMFSELLSYKLFGCFPRND